LTVGYAEFQRRQSGRDIDRRPKPRKLLATPHVIVAVSRGEAMTVPTLSALYEVPLTTTAI
jgi:hypothetical protein